MSGKHAKARRKQVLVRYVCAGCDAWFLVGPDGEGLCDCGLSPPHPPDWGHSARADAPGPREAAWWDRTFGAERKVVYWCPTCHAKGLLLAQVLKNVDIDWDAA